MSDSDPFKISGSDGAGLGRHGGDRQQFLSADSLAQAGDFLRDTLREAGLLNQRGLGRVLQDLADKVGDGHFYSDRQP